jgi:hypothetical protein
MEGTGLPAGASGGPDAILRSLITPAHRDDMRDCLTEAFPDLFDAQVCRLPDRRRGLRPTTLPLVVGCIC